MDAADTAAPEGRNALSQLWGTDGKDRLVPVHECDIAVVTYEALMDELRRAKRSEPRFLPPPGANQGF